MALEKIHEADVGIGDLSPSNVLINSKNSSIKIIDFETAGIKSEKFDQGLATPGFVSKNSETREQADWFSFLRIVYSMLMPIAPVQDIDPINEIKIDNWIKQNYGNTAYKFIIDIKQELQSKFPKLIVASNDKLIRGYTRGELICKIRDGIESNLKPQKKQLLPGDIRQFETSGGMLNVLTGGFGIIMSLARTGGLPSEANDWIDKYSNEKYLTKLNSGLFSGKAGIACLLYELGYQERAREIMASISWSNGEDVSIISGMSGIGLAYLSFYKADGCSDYLENAKKIAEKIFDIFNSNLSITSEDPDFIPKGLLDGWSGAAVFYCALYNILRDDDYLLIAERLITKELEDNCALDDLGILHIDDEMRLLPYLAGGGVGVAISLLELLKYTKNPYLAKKLEQSVPLANTMCCYNSGLFRGYASFILFSGILKQEIGINDNQKESELLNTLMVYTVEEDGKLMLPGDYGYKLSGDLFSGASGVLLALNSLEGNNWKNIFPIIQSTLDDIL